MTDGQQQLMTRILTTSVLVTFALSAACSSRLGNQEPVLLSSCEPDDLTEQEELNGVTPTKRSLQPLASPQILQWGLGDEHVTETFVPLAAPDSTFFEEDSISAFGGPRRNGQTRHEIPLEPLTLVGSVVRDGRRSAMRASPTTAGAGLDLIIVWESTFHVRSADLVEYYALRRGGLAELQGAWSRDDDDIQPAPALGLEFSVSSSRVGPEWRRMASTSTAFAIKLAIMHPSASGSDSTVMMDPPLDDPSPGYRCDLLVAAPRDYAIAVHHLAHGSPDDSRWRLEAGLYDWTGQYFGLYGDGIRDAAAGVDTDGLVVATDKGIVWTDGQLRPTHELLMPLRPRALSTGDDDSVYMVNQEGPELLRLDSTGAEIFRTPLGGSVSVFPPAIGPDGGAIVASQDRITSVGPAGQIRWEIPRDSNTPVSVNHKGVVVASDRTRALAIEPEGKLHELWRGSQRLTSVPTRLYDTIVIATATHILELKLPPKRD